MVTASGKWRGRNEPRYATSALLAGTSGFERSDSDELPLHPSFVFSGYTRIPLNLKPR